jgi:RES domain-containing protein
LRVWRLTRAPFASAAFSGIGPARGGARWNSRGIGVAYAASSRSLAELEILVHIDRTHAPTDFVFAEAEIPNDAIELVKATSLPTDWRSMPPPPELRVIGDAWIRAQRSLALRVPSVVVPEEFNLLVNPVHPRFNELRLIGKPEPVLFDARLFS